MNVPNIGFVLLTYYHFWTQCKKPHLNFSRIIAIVNKTLYLSSMAVLNFNVTFSLSKWLTNAVFASTLKSFKISSWNWNHVYAFLDGLFAETKDKVEYFIKQLHLKNELKLLRFFNFKIFCWFSNLIETFCIYSGFSLLKNVYMLTISWTYLTFRVKVIQTQDSSFMKQSFK